MTTLSKELTELRIKTVRKHAGRIATALEKQVALIEELGRSCENPELSNVREAVKASALFLRTLSENRDEMVHSLFDRAIDAAKKLEESEKQ